jgi:hypothetical protein
MTISNIHLKELLRLFNTTDDLTIIELGDTWHPADGFVDESYFNNIKTVQQFLEIEYDFKGLVIFNAQINDVAIKYNPDTDKFELDGNEQTIERIAKQFKIGE